MSTIIPSKKRLCVFLNEHGCDVKPNKRGDLTTFNLPDGEVKRFGYVHDLVTYINENSSLSIDVDTAKWSWGTGYTFDIVSGDKQPQIVEQKELAPVVVEEEIVTETTQEKDQPDFDQFENMEDTKENRLVLDEYAEQFGIKLRRNAKLVNMLKKFKTDWAGK